MIFTNQEKLLKFLDVEDDIEANPAKSIEEEDTELVNCHGHDHLVQDLLLITGIPLIAIDSNKEDANDKGTCKDNEGSRQRNDRSSSSCTASSDIAGSSLISNDLFLSQVKCGLMLGIFLWPAIRIFLFTLLTKCEPVGNIFFAKDIKEQQDQPEMPNWLTAFVYVPLCTSGAWWHNVFMVETLLTNCMILCMYLKSYITKSGCLCNGKLYYGIMYSPMVMNVASFLGQVNPENMTVESWVLIAIILSSSAIILALVGYYAASKLVPFTAMLIAYTVVCVEGLGLLMYSIM